MGRQNRSNIAAFAQFSVQMPFERRSFGRDCPNFGPRPGTHAAPPHQAGRLSIS